MVSRTRAALLAALLGVLPGARARPAPAPTLPVTEITYLGGGVADTFRGRIAGRLHALKPSERLGDSGRFGDWGQGNAEGELVSLPLLRAVGLRAPAPLLFRAGAASPLVLATEWVSEELAGGVVHPGRDFFENADLVDRADAAAFARMFLMDVVTVNNDRHGGNFFVVERPDGSVHPVPIDHNLALHAGRELGEGEEGRFPRLGPRRIRRLVAGRCGPLGKRADWGPLVASQVDRVVEALSDAALDQVLGSLPDEIPAGRRRYIRELIRHRRDGLAAAVEAWSAGWIPAPAEPVPGIFGWMIAWNPEGSAAIAGLVLRLLEEDPEREERVRRITYLAPRTAPDLAATIREIRAVVARYLTPEKLEAVDDAVETHLGRLQRARVRADAVLRALTSMDAPTRRRVVADLLQMTWERWDPGVGRLHEVALALLREEGVRFPLVVALALTEAAALPFVPEDSPDLPRLRAMLEASRADLHDRADRARLRARAARLASSDLGRRLREHFPDARPDAVHAAMIQLLEEAPGTRFEFGEAGPRPGDLARGLRALAAASADPLPRSELLGAVLDEAHLEAGALHLAGWEGPVDLNDPAVGADHLQAAGLPADPAARVVFERMAHGPFRGRADLLARVDPSDLQDLLIVPGAPGLPPLPRLVAGKGLFATATCPRGALVVTRGGEDRRELELALEVEGLERLDWARFRIEPAADGRGWVVAGVPADGPHRERLAALGIEDGEPLPHWIRRLWS